MNGRFEYNTTHKYQEHTTSLPEIDEDLLTPEDQEWLNKETSFAFAVHEKNRHEDSYIDKPSLSKRISSIFFVAVIERSCYNLCKTNSNLAVEKDEYYRIEKTCRTR